MIHMSAQAGHRGFTLIEILVTIAIIVILIALMFPSLSTVRDAARQVRSASDLRQHLVVFTMYNNDWDDQYPFFTNPHATSTVLRTSIGTHAIEYFSANNFWPYAMYDDYYPGTEPESDLFLSPFWNTTGHYAPYIYSCSLIARPEYWDPNTRSGRSQLKPVRATDVRYTSAKGVLSLDLWSYRYQRGMPSNPRSGDLKAIVAVAAGAVLTVHLDELGEVMRSGDGGMTNTLGGHQIGTYPAAAHTFQGANGLDIIK